jgi:hypothetical protein
MNVLETVKNELHNLESVAAVAAPFIPGPLGAAAKVAVAVEPIAEEVLSFIQNLITSGADHSGAVGAAAQILQELGQKLTVVATYAPPPKVSLAASST